MTRRFLTALLLAMWLLGIAQLAFACASRSECCPIGSTTGCGGEVWPAASWAALHSCCATHASTPSPVSVRARSEQAQPPAPGPQGSAGFAALNSFFRERAAWTPLPRGVANSVFDESLTYLRTARLRL